MQGGSYTKIKDGETIDVDRNGAWCVDLIHAYCDYLGAGKIWGNANSYPYVATPEGFTKIEGASIQPGDVAIWTGGAYGHVAIALSTDEIIDQAGSGYPEKCKIRRMYYTNGYWGVLRPNFNSETPTTPQGSRMETGGSRTISDGDYYISSALTGNSEDPGKQCLTIGGLPGNKNYNGANAEIWPVLGDKEHVFTVTWLRNGFYKKIEKLG